MSSFLHASSSMMAGRIPHKFRTVTILSLMVLFINIKIHHVAGVHEDVLRDSGPEYFLPRLLEQNLSLGHINVSINHYQSVETKYGLFRDGTSKADKITKNCTDLESIVKHLNRCGWEEALLLESVHTNVTLTKSVIRGCEEDFNQQNTETLTMERNIECISSLIFKAFEAEFIRVQHFRIHSKTAIQGESLSTIITNAYIKNNVKNIVWVSDHPWEVVEAAEEAFETVKRGLGSLMLHNIRFVLISVDDSNLVSSEIGQSSLPFSYLQSEGDDRTYLLTARRLNSSKFDNVLQMSYLASSIFESSQCGLTKPRTLMWRPGHVREFQNIRFNSAYGGDNSGRKPFKDAYYRYRAERECHLFPNIRNLMNGRHLVVIAKVDPPVLLTNKAGTEYSGFIVDVIDALSLSMNFTYSLTPDPRKSRNVPLQYFERKISEGEADFMAKLYYLTSPLVYNFSVTHPIISANMRGAYVAENEYQISSVFFMYNTNIYYGICFVFFSFLLLYTFVSRCTHWWLTEKSSLHLEATSTVGLISRTTRHLSIPQDYRDEPRTEPIFQEPKIKEQVTGKLWENSLLELRDMVNYSDLEVTYYTRCLIKDRLRALFYTWVKQIKSFSGELVDSFLQVFGSLLGHDTIPRPTFLSARSLLFSWTISITLAFACLKSNITVEMMWTTTTPPIKSFNEMISGGKYRWGHYNSSFLPVMENSRSAPLKLLYDGMMRFMEQDPSVVAENPLQLVNKVVHDDGFVGIVDSFSLRLIMMNNNLKNIKVIKETLGTNGFGLSLPPTSELSDLMSEHIMRLTDAGLVQAFMEKVEDTLKETNVDIFGAKRNDKGTQNVFGVEMDIEMLDAFGIFFFCPMCIICASAVLLLEIAVFQFSNHNR